MSAKHAGNLLAKLTADAGLPSALLFQVTERCNYDCVHCFQTHEKQEELSLDEIVRVLEELAGFGLLFITFMGGEFFTRRDADDILRAAHRLGFAIKVKTTGHFITDKRADFLATIRPLQIDLSVYSANHKIHDDVTAQDGSLQRTLDAAKRLIERKILVQFNCPVMSSNVGDATNLSRLAKEMGAQCTFDPKITSMTNGDQDPVRFRISMDQLHDLYTNHEIGVPQHLERQFAIDANEVNDHPCGAASSTVSIVPNGDVWPCNSLPISCGNVREKSFSEIWFGSNKMKEIRNIRYADISECNRCPVRRYCNRCHAMALIEQGELKGPSLEACRHAVVARDSLRARGLLPEDHTQLPPTWDRIDLEGVNHRPRLESDKPGIVRSSALRVL